MDIKKIQLNRTYIFLFVFSIITRFINSLSSPLFPDFCFQGDNTIFYCMGREILRGKVLYKDMVDNKPPYTFFINTIGSIFEYKHIGIFIIEIIILFVTLIFVYKIVKLFVKSNTLSVIGALFFSLLMNNTYITLGMSKTECYVIPFTLIAIFYLIKHYLNDGILCDRKFLFILGLCAGFSFMFNQKSAFFFIAVAIVLFIQIIVNKYKNVNINNINKNNQEKYSILKVLLGYILFGLLGMVIVILPYIVYMIITDSASYAYTCIFEMAINYISSDASIYYESAGPIGLILNYIMEYKLFFVFILISLLIVIWDVKNLYIKLTYIIALVLTIYAISAANNRYMYYLASLYIYLLPIYIFIAKRVDNLFITKLNTKTTSIVLYIVFTIMILLINIPIGYGMSKRQYFAKHNFNEGIRNELRKYYDDLDKVKVLAPGFNPEVYMAVNLHIDFPCFFTMNNTYEAAPVFYNQQLKYIEKKQPDVVVIRPTSSYTTFPEIMQEKIKAVLSTDYKRIGDVDSNSNYGVYELYIRNDG